jgi:hypothetical protein
MGCEIPGTYPPIKNPLSAWINRFANPVLLILQPTPNHERTAPIPVLPIDILPVRYHLFWLGYYSPVAFPRFNLIQDQLDFFFYNGEFRGRLTGIQRFYKFIVELKVIGG